MFRRNIIKIYNLSPFNKGTSLYKNFVIIRDTGCKCLATKYQHTDEYITKKLTDEEYLVKLKDDPNIFGSDSNTVEYDEGDLKENEYLEEQPSPTQKLQTKQYADIIKDLIRKKKIKEAVDVLEVRMIKDDRVKPENYIYNLLLGACGRVGYTKKAFSLYNKMKQRNLKVTGGTYTALFNACANSPFPEDGLERARHLREIMVEKGYEPNDTNYNAMIKAFGRCKDLATAFSIADEMQQKNIRIKEDTLNFLLQACISDKEAGFRHSLLVWRKFIEKGIRPDIYSYNLLLRCVRECGLGDVETTKSVISNLIDSYKPPTVSSYRLNSGNLVIDEEVETIKDSNMIPNRSEFIGKDSVNKDSIIEHKPNLIGNVPHLGNILAVSEITKPEDRLLLLGGCSGLLKNMKDNRCWPNAKTFTLLLDSIPSTLVAEKELLTAVRKANVRTDIDFYNMLIKKRSMRCEYEYGKDVLKMIKTANLRPDIITFGVLALGCKTKEEADSLIEEMQSKNFRMNPEILGAMLHQACYHSNFSYVLELMEICIREEIRPNKKFMDCLEEFKKKCKKSSNESLGKTKSFQKGFQIFKLRYNSWKEQVDPLDDAESHPWQQFKETSDTNIKHYKDKDLSSRFKARHTSVFRQKKMEILNSKGKTVYNKKNIKSKSNYYKNNKNVTDVEGTAQINQT